MRSIFALLVLALSVATTGARQPGASRYRDLKGEWRQPLDPGAKLASVLIFYGHDCPISNSYAPEINRICAAYTNFDFYIVQVDADLSVATARQHAREYALTAPVLLDPKHVLVKKTRVNVTPEAVVAGKQGKILYRGRIDDQYPELGKKRAAPTQNDLRNALDDIQAGRPVRNTETKAIGCIIGR